MSWFIYSNGISFTLYSSSSSLYCSSYSFSFITIHSYTNVSRLFFQIPLLYFHTLLFLISLCIWVITFFLCPLFYFSYLFLLVAFLQLFSQGLCQLHSISAYLGRIFCRHNSSLLFRMC